MRKLRFRKDKNIAQNYSVNKWWGWDFSLTPSTPNPLLFDHHHADAKWGTWGLGQGGMALSPRHPLRGKAAFLLGLGVHNWRCHNWTMFSLHVASVLYVLLFPHMVLKSTSLTVRANRCGEAIPEEIDHWQMSEHTWFLEASQGAAFSHRNSGTPATRGKRLSIFLGCFWRNQS